MVIGQSISAPWRGPRFCAGRPALLTPGVPMPKLVWRADAEGSFPSLPRREHSVPRVPFSMPADRRLLKHLLDRSRPTSEHGGRNRWVELTMPIQTTTKHETLSLSPNPMPMRESLFDDLLFPPPPARRTRRGGRRARFGVASPGLNAPRGFNREMLCVMREASHSMP